MTTKPPAKKPSAKKAQPAQAKPPAKKPEASGPLVRVHRLIPGGYQCSGPMGPKGWHPDQLAKITVRERLTPAQREALLRQIADVVLAR